MIKAITSFLLLCFLVLVVLNLALYGALEYSNWNQLVIGGSLMRLQRWILESRMIILIIDHPSIFRHIRNIFIANLVCSNLVQDLLVDTGFVEVD